MTAADRTPITHPAWCARSLCTSPALVPTDEEHAATHPRRPAHRSSPIILGHYGTGDPVVGALTQPVTPAGTAEEPLLLLGPPGHPVLVLSVRAIAALADQIAAAPDLGVAARDVVRGRRLAAGRRRRAGA